MSITPRYRSPLGKEDGNYFGYKRHTVTDENGMVLTEETTAANESDMKHLETPLKKAKLPRRALVYADKGYDSMENKETLKRMKRDLCESLFTP